MDYLFRCGGKKSKSPNTITLSYKFRGRKNANGVLTFDDYADIYTGDYKKCIKVTYSGSSILNMYGVPAVGSITPYTTIRIGMSNQSIALDEDQWAEKGVSITLSK